jgi:dihydroorotate dehydrogenase (fumarate)
MDLSTKYLGLQLKNPIVHAASPLSKDLEMVKRMEDAGASAVVMYSLFEEQIDHEKKELDHFLTVTGESFAEALSYFPEPEHYISLDAEDYLNHIAKLKSAVSLPIIASLNGVSSGGWMRYAKQMEEAGADAIELNVYYIPTNPAISSERIEQMYVDDLKTVKQSVRIPVALKVGPFFTAFAATAKKFDEAGADGLVLFNRFFGPEINLETMEVEPKLTLSTQAELALPLRWIAVLYGNIKADLAATSGIHESEDVLRVIMAGASVAMIASTLLKHGVGHVENILSGMKRWMEQHEYDSITQMRGSMSYQAIAEPAAYERANYMKTLQSYR